MVQKKSKKFMQNLVPQFHVFWTLGTLKRVLDETCKKTFFGTLPFFRQFFECCFGGVHLKIRGAFSLRFPNGRFELGVPKGGPRPQ